MKQLIIKPPFQTHFAVKTNCDKLIGALLLKHGKYISLNPESGNAPHCIEALCQNGRYYIRYFDQTFESEYAIDIIDNILFQNTAFDNAVFALHGAAVEWNGKAYIFLASTTGGKTTLASYLTGNGFGYITDDCILLDKQTFRVHPYTTPLHLRDGGVEVLKKLDALPKHLDILNDGLTKRYTYTPQNCIDKPLPLNKIFFIRRTDRENRLIALDTKSRMINLLHAPITVYPLTPEYLKFISSLSKVDCSELHYCDMNFAAEVIKHG